MVNSSELFLVTCFIYLQCELTFILDDYGKKESIRQNIRGVGNASALDGIVGKLIYSSKTDRPAVLHSAFYPSMYHV